MSFAGCDEPSTAFTFETRGSGRPVFAEPSSFNVTADTMRIVAVAYAMAGGGRIGAGVAERAAAAANRTIIGIANAFAPEW